MNPSNENKLLLYCARTGIPEKKLEEIKYLVSLPVNWEELLESAFSQGIAPLLYYNLKNIRESNLIPQEVTDYLKKVYHRNVAGNMYLFTELRRILEAFNECRIDVMVLKGAALAGTVYGDIGLRSMLDIDLLVKQGDLPHAKKIMSDLDYVAKTEIKSEGWYRKNHFHLPQYIHKEKSIVVEIHWHVTGAFDINIKKWWERAGTAEIEHYQVLIPSPEDMLIHLCLHLYHQDYNAEKMKRGICDIYETLKYYKEVIDWGLFDDKINLCRMVKPVYSILHLIKKYYENREKSLIRINPDHIDLEFIKILENRIVMSSSFPGPFIKYYVADGCWDKAKSLFAGVFPNREAMIDHYPVSLNSKKIYFYYLIRPFKLFLKYGKFLFEIFRLKKYSIEG